MSCLRAGADLELRKRVSLEPGAVVARAAADEKPAAPVAADPPASAAPAAAAPVAEARRDEKPKSDEPKATKLRIKRLVLAEGEVVVEEVPARVVREVVERAERDVLVDLRVEEGLHPRAEEIFVGPAPASRRPPKWR